MSIHAELLDWYDANARELPWRRTKDPYAIWVSEIMLQQTQVATVIPYFERWMARFPTFDSLASASEGEVLTIWQGLGYYRRAKLLLAGAKSLGDRPPRTAEEWLKVPGVGRYTAAAIASIAFNEPVPLVDGNVERVYARLTADDSSGAALTKNAWQWATEMVYRERPGDWNQALMELGATICRPSNPDCASCPLSSSCRGFLTGLQSSLPTPTNKPLTVPMVHHVWVPICGKRLGIRQIPAGQWWSGMWEFPRATSVQELKSLFPDVCPKAVGSFRHSVTHHRIRVHVSQVQLQAESVFLTWLTPDELSNFALPAPQRKALRMVRG